MSTGPPLELGPPSPQPSQRLSSWKEIATYLNRTVRTAQRWEQVEGLPVHRHGHDKRDSVYAYAEELDEWLGRRRRLVEHEEAGANSPTGRPRRLLIGAAGVLILAAATAAVWHHWSGSHPALPFAPRDWVVLADFDNQTGNPLFDRALRTAFAVSLQQSQHLNLVPRSRMEAALRRMGKPPDARIDEATGREMCMRENAKGLIRCAISRIGSQYAISARLLDPNTGLVVAAFMERAEGDNKILDVLGGLAAKVRRGFGEPLASIHWNDERLPQVTTSSLPALRAYAEGKSLWDRGQHDRAVELFKSAVQHDPDFAMAHAALGSALLSPIYANRTEGKRHYDRALQLGGRVTDRERLSIQAQYHASLGHFEEAAEAYRAYFAAYPDDIVARRSLAHLLMENERPGEAIEHYQHIVRVSPGDTTAVLNLAAGYVMFGRPAEALPYYAKAFAVEPGWLTARDLNHEYGFALAASGNRAKAREIFALALARPETRASGLRSLAWLDMYEGKYRSARELLRQAATRTDARGHQLLALLLQAQGDRRGALAELDEAARALKVVREPAIDAASRIGVSYARAGGIAPAARLLAETAPRADRQNPREMAEVRVLEGEIALARRHSQRAIERFAMALRAANHPLPLAALARAYDQAGNPDQAIACYQSLIEKGSRTAGWEAQQDWLEAHARLAELQLARGDKAGAAAALKPLAALWSNADLDLPLAKRIGRLREALR